MRALRYPGEESGAWFWGNWAVPVVQAPAVGCGQRDERGREAIAWGRGDIRGQAVERR